MLYKIQDFNNNNVYALFKDINNNKNNNNNNNNSFKQNQHLGN